MTDQEIIYKAISEVVNTDKPSEFAAHNSTCYTIAKYVCEELREELNTLPAEQPSEDLEKEIDRFQKAKYGGDVISVASIACHFAIWQKEQMMKSAIDAIITSRWKDSHVCLTTKRDIPQIYSGDMVKVIIIKVDEQ